jgi:hypothetical protein
MTRTRRCNAPFPKNGGNDCLGPKVDEKLCTTCNMHGHCDAAAGVCRCDEGYSGTDCSCVSNTTECHGLAACRLKVDGSNETACRCPSGFKGDGKKICVEDVAVPLRADGQWTEWSTWGRCSHTCGEVSHATQSRRRSCTKPAPVNGSHSCEGLHYDVQRCTAETPACGGKGVCDEAASACVCDDGFRGADCSCNVTANCHANAICSKDGNTCICPIGFTGDGLSTCMAGTMDHKIVVGGWSEWTPLSLCVGGEITTQRFCSNPEPRNGGKSCTGVRRKATPC